MKSLLLKFVFPFLGGGMLLLLGGCLNFEPVSDPTRTFVLGVQGVDTVQAENRAFQVSVERVEIPSYLQDRRLVVRKSEAEVDYQEFIRWAEPLRDGIARVVAGNLSQHAAIRGVSHYPWKQHYESDFQVRLLILKFETNASGLARLEVIYEILAPEATSWEVLREKRSFSTETNPQSPDEHVAALSRLLKQLSESILSDLLKS